MKLNILILFTLILVSVTLETDTAKNLSRRAFFFYYAEITMYIHRNL
jgi:hypothetical protein